MYLKKLHITNFRCFADYEIELAPRVTVLFGKNGSGKTTLIDAIHKALSFMMFSVEIKEIVPKGKKAKVLEIRTFRKGNPYPKYYENFKVTDFKDYEHAMTEDSTITIEAMADFENVNVEGKDILPLDWRMTGSAPKFSVKSSGFRPAFMDLYGWYKESPVKPQLPLLAYYSDGFPHNTILNQSKSTEKEKRLYHLRCDYPELGYTDWNLEKGFTNVWLDRLAMKLRRIDAIPREDKATEKLFEKSKIDEGQRALRLSTNKIDFDACKNEINKITECLHRFFEGDPYFEVASLELGITNSSEVCVVTPKYDRTPFNVLPAGYKRLFYMALDMAYRSFLLSNGESTDIPGIAIIDEIDLHLHPELEQVVLQRFMTTFTKVQFIISTHSPSVLSDIETKSGENCVLKMSPQFNNPVKWHNIHGIDYNQMLEENMDVSKRKPEIEAMFKKAWDAVAAKDVECANKAVEELESITPKDQTELVKLRAIISRLKIIGR